MRDSAVLVLDGVVRILPALVVEANRRARFVFLKAVLVAVPVLEHPFERCLRVWPVTVEDLPVSRTVGRTTGCRRQGQRRRDVLRNPTSVGPPCRRPPGARYAAGWSGRWQRQPPAVPQSPSPGRGSEPHGRGARGRACQRSRATIR